MNCGAIIRSRSSSRRPSGDTRTDCRRFRSTTWIRPSAQTFSTDLLLLFQILQDLKGVSELLDSCTLMDLGSDVQTSRLLEHFSQARPHFTVSPGFAKPPECVPQEPQRTLKNQGKFQSAINQRGLTMLQLLLRCSSLLLKLW